MQEMPKAATNVRLRDWHVMPPTSGWNDLCLNSENSESKKMWVSLLCLEAIPLFEALDAASRVDKLLLPSVKWVACRANLDFVVASDTARGEICAACARNRNFGIVRVDIRFHGISLIT